MVDMKLNLSVKPEVFDAVDARGSDHSQIVNRDLDRYYTALTVAREQLREKLALEEIGLILDSLHHIRAANGDYVRLVWAEIESAIKLEHKDETWLVNGDQLIETVIGLSFIERCALADAVERWWNRLAKGERPDISEALA